MKPSRILLLTTALAVSVIACAKEESAAPAEAVDKAVAVHAAEASSKSLEERIADGGKTYSAHCAACHQAAGQGLAGAFPPLAESDYLADGPGVAINAVLNGLSGPITVNGKDYNAVMPNLSYLSDSDVADVVTFVMNSWDNPGGSVSSGEVAAVRGGELVTARGDHPVPASEELAYRGAPSAITGEGATMLIDSEGPGMTQPEFEIAQQVYFERCAGCHGVLRKGATGKPLTPDITREKGTDYLKALITYGSAAGMPNWGTSGDLTDVQIDIMARYLQHEPPAPPEFGLPEMNASWKVLVKPEDRPSKPQHDRNIENFFSVTLRDAGQVAIIDGDTNEEIARLSTGFAVHILRSSSTGRYFYAIGRDGLVTMIDLWTTVPTIVANVKGCHDARSIDASKFPGFEDTYLIEGCYWPPQYVVYDGLTLEPIQLVGLPMVDINGDPLVENRVASIVASHSRPEWVVSQKEAGFVSIVPYADPLDFSISANIATAKFLHDGGFDHTGDYFLVAANASNLMVAVNLNTQMLEALIPTGQVPHPGRGVNWFDPNYGWVNATSHIGEGKVTVYGADPVGRPDVAWQIVREITLPSSGSLFIKSHEASPWVLVDMTLSATGYDKDICAISKATGTLDRCFTVATNGKAVHFEFNMDGSEVMVSDWDPDGAVIVLDSQTLTEVRRTSGLPTPTGKFNVFNTAHDIY